MKFVDDDDDDDDDEIVHVSKVAYTRIFASLLLPKMRNVL